MIDFNNPSGPVMSSPRSLAALTSCAIAALSDGVAVDDERRLLASLGIELTLVIVSVISDQPSRQPTLACQVRTSIRRTVPITAADTAVSPKERTFRLVFRTAGKPGIASADHVGKDYWLWRRVS